MCAIPRAIKINRRLAGLTVDLFHCRRGIAAVEFALILPVLILLLLGTTELTRALTHDRKVTQIASTVADLIAQTSTLSVAELDDIFEASGSIMQPYLTTDLGIITSSVKFNEDKDANVEWSCGYQTTAWTKDTPPPIAIPDAIKVPNSTIIIAVSSYTYKPVFTSIIEENIDLGETFFLRPRLVAEIPDPNC